MIILKRALIRTGKDHLVGEHLMRITGPFMEAIAAGECVRAEDTPYRIG